MLGDKMIYIINVYHFILSSIVYITSLAKLWPGLGLMTIHPQSFRNRDGYQKESSVESSSRTWKRLLSSCVEPLLAAAWHLSFVDCTDAMTFIQLPCHLCSDRSLGYDLFT